MFNSEREYEKALLGHISNLLFFSFPPPMSNDKGNQAYRIIHMNAVSPDAIEISWLDDLMAPAGGGW